MTYEVKIKEIPKHIVYFKKYTVGSLNDFFQGEANLLQDLSDKVISENPNIDLAETDYNVIAYLNGNYPDQMMNIEFCDEVTGIGKECEDYAFKEVDRFMAATILHKGPFEQTYTTHRFLEKWIKENGYIIIGYSRDRAIDGPWNKNVESEYLTRAYIQPCKWQ